LKEQIIAMKEKEERIEKDMAEVQAQNKKTWRTFENSERRSRRVDQEIG
jgi:hypothetical protein